MQDLIPDGHLEFLVHISSPEEVIDRCDIRISALELEEMETDCEEARELVPTHVASVECPDAGIVLGKMVGDLVASLTLP